MPRYMYMYRTDTSFCIELGFEFPASRHYNENDAIGYKPSVLINTTCLQMKGNRRAREPHILLGLLQTNGIP